MSWKTKSFWQNALLLIGALGLAGGLAESGLRLSKAFQPLPRCYVGEYQDRPSRYFTPDPLIGWKMVPHAQFAWDKAEYQSSYRANAQGFRAPADFLATTEHRKIVVVGDSFTFGTGVQYDDTYGAQLAAALPGSLVYNLGMPAFGIDQMWLSIRHYALPLQPDLIIVGLCDTDFSRSQTAYRLEEGRNKPAFQVVSGQLVRKTPADRFHPVLHFLERSSHVWMAGRMFARWVGYYVPVGEWWSLNEAILDAIQADGRTSQVPVVFVYIPTQSWRPFATLQTYMHRTAAHYIDLQAGLPAPPRDLYYPIDGHFNAKGHAYAATMIRAWIQHHLPTLFSGTTP